MIRRPGLYQLCNVIDLVASVYGAVTMLLVLSLAVSEMEPRTFAKGGDDPAAHHRIAAVG
jgi:hypothetical protein